MAKEEGSPVMYGGKTHCNLYISDCEEVAHRLPTDEERRHLRKVSDNIPWSAYALCLFVCIQWGAASGAGAVLYNFVQFPLPKGGNGTGATPRGTQQTPGALGFGLQKTNAIFVAIRFLSPFLNLFGAWLADVKIGRFGVLTVATGISCIYMVLLVVSGIPSILRAGNSVVPFMIAYCLRVLLAIPLYGPVVSPVIMDQYSEKHDYVKRLSNGQYVIVSRTATLSRIQWLFYALGNIGPFLSIGTTWAEKKIGFWLSFTVPCIITFFLPLILLVIYRRAVKVKPDGRQLSQAVWVFWIVLKREKWRLFFRADAWNAAKPASLPARDSATIEAKQIAWDDDYVEQVKHSYAACKVFFFFIIYDLAGGGLGQIGSTQASSLSTNGVPNDFIDSLDPITVVVVMPVFTYGIFPFLRSHGIKCGMVSRMTTGFILKSLASFYGAFVQWQTYRTSPCGYHATGCEIGSGVSHISVWVTAPIPVLTGVSGLLAYTAVYEIAYLQSPEHMKSITLSILLFVGIFYNAINAACTAAITDPYLIWVWAVPGVANLIQTAYLHWNYKYLDA